MVGSAEICRSIAFWGVAAVLFSLFAALGAIFVYRVYASLSKMAKRIGLAAMALLGLLSIGATISGSPTLEDKSAPMRMRWRGRSRTAHGLKRSVSARMP